MDSVQTGAAIRGVQIGYKEQEVSEEPNIQRPIHREIDVERNEKGERYDDETLTTLIAFAGMMVATNLFNTVAKVPLDDVLYSYINDKKETD